MSVFSISKNFYVTCAAVNVSLSFFSYYYSIGIFNSLQEALMKYVFPNASILQSSSFASIPFLGATVGALLAQRLANMYGRRITLIISNIISLFGVILTIMPNLYLFIMGRGVIGFNGGISLILANIYITEISEEPLRGQLCILPSIASGIATLVAFGSGGLIPVFIEHGNAKLGCRVLLIIPAIVNIIKIFILLFVFKFETPLYLIMQEKEAEAKEVLGLLYNSQISSKLEGIIQEKNYVYNNDQVPLKEVLLPKGKFWKALVTSIPFVFTWSVMGGVVPLVFSNMIFSQGMESSYTPLPLILTGIIGFLCLLFSIFALILVKRFGRRPLSIFGFSMLFSINLAITIIIYIDSVSSMAVKILILLWVVQFASIIQPLTFLYPSEVLPDIGIVVLRIIATMASFVMAFLFMPLQLLIGYFYLYLIFTFLSGIGLATVFFYLVETKDRLRLEGYSIHGDTEEERIFFSISVLED